MRQLKTGYFDGTRLWPANVDLPDDFVIPAGVEFIEDPKPKSADPEPISLSQVAKGGKAGAPLGLDPKDMPSSN